jgi:hypothetical protein
MNTVKRNHSAPTEQIRPTAKLSALAIALSIATGCGQAPVQTGPDHVPDSNIAISAAKDGKFNTMAWPLVDAIMIDWLDGPFAPGCAVGVSVNDEVVYLKGYGRAKMGIAAEDWGVATMGAIGSVSKTFTALAAVHQRERSWADFEDQVKDRLPINGALGNAILFKLLSNTAGAGGGSRAAAFAPNWVNGQPLQQCANVVTPDPADPFCTEAHRAALDPVALVSEYAGNEANNVFVLPSVDADGNGSADGWQAIYSNVGYTVAGGMVGAVAEAHGYAGYEDYVWKEIGRWSDNPLAPGQATSLALIHGHRADDIPNRAVGYFDANWGMGAKNWTAGDAWDVVESRGSWIGPSGGWAVTIGDFTRLLAAYQANNLVNGTSRHWMELKIGHLALGPDAMNLPPYGLGLIIDDNNGSRYHGGDIGVFSGGSQQSTNSAVWSLWPAAVGSDDVGVAMMCNNGKSSGSLYSIAKDIVEAMQDSPASRPVSTQTHATRPAAGVLDRQRYRIDASQGYVLLPDGLPMLPSVANPLTLEADLAQGRVLLRNVGRTGGSGSTAGALGNTRLSSKGRLSAEGGQVQLGVGSAPLTLRSASLSFQVANDGSRLYDGIAQGSLDARQLVQMGVAQSTAQVCDAVRAADSSCVPCDDGARVCFGASIGGLVADREQTGSPGR